MASQFQKESLKIVIGQICQTIGFQGINSTPLDVMIDLLHRYIRELAISTVRYTEHAGRTIPNLEDMSLAFREMGISITELEEYVTNVEPTPFPYEIPKIPVARQSNLNFLKPGAKEIVSRPLYVHEHLPPMYPEKEEPEVSSNANSESLENEAENCSDVKTPISPSRIKRTFSEGEMSPNKKFKSHEEEGEPVREIDSVMMTTSGFISSAREGKYPEAKRPNIPMSLPRSNSPTSYKIPSLVKKKATMEKIIKNKNHHRPIGIIPGSLSNSKSKEFKFKPKIPSAPPGTGSLKYSRPGGIPPKLKIPVPNLPPANVLDSGIVLGETIASFPKDTPEKRKRRERDRERRRERKREKEREEKKNEKNDEKPKKERSKDDKRRRDKVHHTKLKNERTRIRMKGLTKEEELKRYKERENELIAALAASSAVTVTSIPPPSLRVREKSPEKIPEKTVTSPQESKSKLSIFKKVSKSKDGDKYISRENSPKLMIDDIVKEEPKSPPPSPTIDFAYHEESVINSSHETPSTPKTPDILPAAKNKRGRPHKIKLEDGTYLSPVKKSPKSPKVKKTSSPRGRKRGSGIFSPSWRHPMGEVTPDRPNLHQSISDRPKTPEGVISQDDVAVPSSFNIPSFPNAPGFIPPFSRFTFGPFGTPPLVPPVMAPPISDSPINSISRVFINSFNDKAEEMDDNRPPTPSHESSQSSHLSADRENLFHNNLSPLPEIPKMPSVEPSPHSTTKLEKLSKLEKEKKKEHKKEKKEKEKLRKKKEKKDKEKAKEEKKREKERLKQEKKEKRKRGRKRSDTGSKDSGVPKITFKLPADGGSVSSSSSLSTAEHKPTPKLVIKPVVKHPNEDSKLLLSLESKKRLSSSSINASSQRLPSIKLPPQDEPGSPPEIAKFSPLITRPPKVKLSSKKNSLEILTVPPLKIKDPSNLKMSKNDLTLSSKAYKDSHKEHKDSHREHKEFKDQYRDYKEHHKEGKEPYKEFKDFNKEHKEPIKEFKESCKDYKEHMKDYKEPHKEIYKESYKESRDSHKEFPKDLIISHIPATVPPLKIRNAPPPKGFEDKKFLNPKKSDKKEKKKKSPPQSISPPMDNTTIKITSILPNQPPSCSVVPDHIKPRLSTPTPKGSRNSSSSGLFSGQVTTPSQTSVGPPNAKISGSGLVTETVGPIGHFVDDQGNEVWICPTCGKQDDGSPMIGCDTCDDWYHWLCVGIHVPPSERENWYCPRCLSQHKQKGLGLIEKKKRGRKKKFPSPI